jgi:hypothetical protein
VKLYYTCLVYKLIWQFSTICLVGYFCSLNEDFARDNTCPELLITEQEVKDQLEILNNSKPSGPDGVAPRILRSVSQCLVSPLTLLFNQSLQCGQLPYIWKRSHVTPVYKNKGVASDITNFRPIALTCVLCKMM